MSVIRNFLSSVRFTKQADHFLETLQRTGSHCAPCWLEVTQREELVGRFENQTLLKPSMSRATSYPGRGKGQGPENQKRQRSHCSALTTAKKPPFNLIAFTLAFSSRLILRALLVEISGQC